jgi:hypothetical protein
MPGGQEPKAKKRKRTVDRREKEKPLLAVQGLLRLDHSFVPPKNAEVRQRPVRAACDLPCFPRPPCSRCRWGIRRGRW